MNSQIKMLVMDIDGTLTDGKIYMGENGEVMKAFNIKDGMAITLIKEKGIIPVIITGRWSRIVENRCRELGIEEVHQGIENKLEKLKEIVKKYNMNNKDVAYIGDDVNDIECMRYSGLSACPCDAVQEVKKIVDYVIPVSGGNGVVRELYDNIITMSPKLRAGRNKA